MHAIPKLSHNEHECFFSIIQESLSIRSHIDYFLWMNGDLQQFVPNEIVLVAWGNFPNGEFCFEFAPNRTDLHIDASNEAGVSAFVKNMYASWVANGYSTLTLKWPDGFIGSDQTELPGLHSMHSALVHGIRNERSPDDVLYVLFDSAKNIPERAGTFLKVLLPYIDAGLRNLPRQRAMPVFQTGSAANESVAQGLLLSPREQEIMGWVRQGKTNQEIGMILNISIFTVKNHLQRIFKKLDVINRAQAVATLSIGNAE